MTDTTEGTCQGHFLNTTPAFIKSFRFGSLFIQTHRSVRLVSDRNLQAKATAAFLSILLSTQPQPSSTDVFTAFTHSHYKLPGHPFAHLSETFNYFLWEHVNLRVKLAIREELG